MTTIASYSATQSLYWSYTQALLQQAKNLKKSTIIDSKQVLEKLWIDFYYWEVDHFTNEDIDMIVYWCTK